MQVTVVIVCAAILAVAGCATMPSYCEPLQQEIESEIARYPDWDIAWMGTAFSQAPYVSELVCICPNDTDREGKRCGGRSAYSRSGGASPLCSPEDVPRSDIPRIRRMAVQRAMPIECGGWGVKGVLDFGRTPADRIPIEWR